MRLKEVFLKALRYFQDDTSRLTYKFATVSVATAAIPVVASLVTSSDTLESLKFIAPFNVLLCIQFSSLAGQTANRIEQEKRDVLDNPEASEENKNYVLNDLMSWYNQDTAVMVGFWSTIPVVNIITAMHICYTALYLEDKGEYLDVMNSQQPPAIVLADSTPVPSFLLEKQ